MKNGFVALHEDFESIFDDIKVAKIGRIKNIGDISILNDDFIISDAKVEQFDESIKELDPENGFNQIKKYKKDGINIGGFDESFIIYEDNILINELYERKEFVVINKKLESSARLYEERGVWYVQYHFWTIYVKKWLGADANELFAYYCKHIRRKNQTAIAKPPVKSPKITEPIKVYSDK